jgi:sugar/nucleoside kinase (ribokinase family)
VPLDLPARRDTGGDVLVVGENSVDLVAVVDPYPQRNTKQPLQSWTYLPGGQAATAAVALARLGWRVEYIGRFGGDDLGRLGLDSLARGGVAIEHVVRCAEATSRFAIVLVDQETGDRTVLWDRHPALTMDAADVPDEAIARARVVLMDATDMAAAVSVATRARRLGVRTVVDVEHVQPGVEMLLRNIDVIIAAEAFPCAMTGISETGAALAALQRDTGAAIVCMTLGAKGSLARCNGIEIRTPAYAVNVVDTTGCGDAFRAGFIAGWLEQGGNAEVEHCLRYANAVAALNGRAVGAQTAAPSWEEVRRCLDA